MKYKIFLLSVFLLLGFFSFQCGGKEKEETVVIELEPEVTVRYDFRLPEDYDPNESYPLLIVMHGYASDESKGSKLWDDGFFYEPNFILLSIRAPFKKKLGGYTWTTETDRIPYWAERREASAPVCEKRIFEVLEQFKKKYNIESNEIYLWGLSAAAPMTYYVGLMNIDVFAGFAICSGLMDRPLLKKYMPDDLDGIDIYLSVGRDEGTGVVQSIQDAKEFLKKAGARVKLYIADGGHMLMPRECRIMQNFFGLCDTKAPEDNYVYRKIPKNFNTDEEEWQDYLEEDEYEEEDESDYQEE